MSDLLLNNCQQHPSHVTIKLKISIPYGLHFHLRNSHQCSVSGESLPSLALILPLLYLFDFCPFFNIKQFFCLTPHTINLILDFPNNVNYFFCVFFPFLILFSFTYTDKFLTLLSYAVLYTLHEYTHVLPKQVWKKYPHFLTYRVYL